MKSLRRHSDHGLAIPFSARRSRCQFTLKFPLNAQGRSTYQIEEIKNAGELERRARQGWREGSTSQSVGAGKR
jgi:hypothetical protein